MSSYILPKTFEEAPADISISWERPRAEGLIVSDGSSVEKRFQKTRPSKKSFQYPPIQESDAVELVIGTNFGGAGVWTFVVLSSGTSGWKWKTSWNFCSQEATNASKRIELRNFLHRQPWQRKEDCLRTMGEGLVFVNCRKRYHSRYSGIGSRTAPEQRSATINWWTYGHGCRKQTDPSFSASLDTCPALEAGTKIHRPSLVCVKGCP